jgi:hypothetical protein
MYFFGDIRLISPFCIFLGLIHPALPLSGTTQCINHTGKFHQQTIAGRFDDAASVFGDLWIDNVCPDRPQPVQGTFLVGPDQPRIPLHISGQNCSEAAGLGHSSGKPARRRPAYSVGSARRRARLAAVPALVQRPRRHFWAVLCRPHARRTRLPRSAGTGGELVLNIAGPELADREMASISQIGAEATVTRLLHRLRIELRLGRFQRIAMGGRNPAGGNSSLLTHRWRERDSNPRSRIAASGLSDAGLA